MNLRCLSLLACAVVPLIFAGCGAGGSSSDSTDSTAAAESGLSPMAALGEKIFSDVSLSASGRQSCGTCHDPQHGHAPGNALPAQLGGPLMDLQGSRSTPGIGYLSFNTSFHFDAEGTPTGGFFWDGRAASFAAQAAEPFLNPVEMANGSRAEVIVRLERAAYAEEFRKLFGSDIFTRVDDAYDRMTLAIQQYEKEDVDFRPFTSKYDEFLRGRVALGDQELRGLALFNSPTKGNCAACHPSGKGADSSFPLFTDFTYDTLGVPRNPELAQNADPDFFDLGLCARPAGDMAARTDLCGTFKVPSLRNVAVRKVFFHNGRFKTLKDTLSFYVQRDTDPQKWYPVGPDGKVKKFDDLPPQYHANVNTTEVPYNRQLGDAPALSDAEIDDVIAFLNTLTDGYAP